MRRQSMRVEEEKAPFAPALALAWSKRPADQLRRTDFQGHLFVRGAGLPCPIGLHCGAVCVTLCMTARFPFQRLAFQNLGSIFDMRTILPQVLRTE